MKRVLTRHKFFHFGPYLAEMPVDPDYCARLLKKGKTLKKPHGQYLAGQIKSEYSYELQKNPWIFEGFQIYVNTWIEGWKKFASRPTFNPTYQLQELWINQMKAKEYNPIHIHTNCDLSFVLFLEVPPSILKEKNITNTAPYGSISFFYGENRWSVLSDLYIVPKVNTLVMFPADLRHQVMHFNSKGIRTSVAGNIKFAEYGIKYS